MIIVNAMFVLLANVISLITLMSVVEDVEHRR